MHPILMDYSIKRALRQSAGQVRLSEAKGCRLLNRIVQGVHALSEMENMKEINLELKKGKLVSVSCCTDLTSKISIKQERDTYTVILQNCEEDQYEGEAGSFLKIRIAVVA